MGIAKIYNFICNYLDKEMEEVHRTKVRVLEKKRRELRGYSDIEIRKMYKKKNELGDDFRSLIEEEAGRRGIH